MQPFIHVHDVQKRYDTSDGGVLAISKVSFDVAAGEFVTVVGPSGCGKSTLLKMMSGLIEPTAGELVIGGEGHEFRPGHDIGMVFQQPLLLKWRSIEDNLLLPVEFLGERRESFRQRARALLKLVGLDGFEGKYPYELSGGMQQRASICRALIHSPKLLLMDEPFGALDALTRERMNLELQRVWMEERKTVIFITHDIQEAVFLADRVIVLTARPAEMAAAIDIELPRPRRLAMKTTPEFGAYCRRLYDLLGFQEEEAAESA
ncbi:MAG: ABC transporter ATP-binding protein [Alphaproteobacteria bacterium]|nr:ABC transporter ATP-binding protein [Alphaproteobacteria bacterium]